MNSRGVRWPGPSARRHQGKLLILLLLAVGAPARSQSTDVIEKPTGTARVLVVSTPSDALARELAGRSGALEATLVSPEAESLEAVRKEAAALGAIESGRWDFVVVTGGPTFGKTLVLDGAVRVGDPSDFLHHGRLLLQGIVRSGARTVLLVPPARPGAPAEDRQALEWAYHRLGRDGGGVLAPVGDAFSRVRRRRPEVALFDPYGEEWSRAGAYLAASVLESTITGRPPLGIAPPEPQGDGREELSSETRRLLDEEAWAAVRDLVASGGYRDIPPPPFPAVPTLPHGDAVPFAELQGSWLGPLRLYPWPATLELQVRSESDGPRVSGRIRFTGSRPGLGFEGLDTAFEDHVLSFQNPADLAEGRTTYRLVAQGHRLTGVAELVTERGDVYAIGGFELRRVREEPGSERP